MTDHEGPYTSEEAVEEMRRVTEDFGEIGSFAIVLMSSEAGKEKTIFVRCSMPDGEDAWVAWESMLQSLVRRDGTCIECAADRINAVYSELASEEGTPCLNN